MLESNWLDEEVSVKRIVVFQANQETGFERVKMIIYSCIQGGVQQCNQVTGLKTCPQDEAGSFYTFYTYFSHSSSETLSMWFFAECVNLTRKLNFLTLSEPAQLPHMFCLEEMLYSPQP